MKWHFKTSKWTSFPRGTKRSKGQWHVEPADLLLSAHLGTSLESVTSRPSKMGSNLALLTNAVLHHLLIGWIASPSYNEENEMISSSIIRNINVTFFFFLFFFFITQMLFYAIKYREPYPKIFYLFLCIIFAIEETSKLF